MAALPDLSSVRINPAMIAMQKQYVVSGGYHWPAVGREFYQIGAVDSTTGDVAAGVSYTGFLEDYMESIVAGDVLDSPLESRMNIGLAKVFGKLSLGISAGLISGFALGNDVANEPLRKLKGTTFGFGVAGFFTKWLRAGVSVENLSNKSVSALAPTTYRAGIAGIFLNGDFTAHVDLVRRYRVEGFEYDIQPRFLPSGSLLLELREPAETLVSSFSVRVYDLLRVIGSVGDSLDGFGDRSGSLGLALVQRLFSISYNLSRTNLQEAAVDSNANLNVNVSF